MPTGVVNSGGWGLRSRIWRRRRIARRARVRRRPGVPDRGPGREPHPFPAPRVIEEALEVPDTPRPPDDPKVQPERHHARLVAALPPQPLEGVDGVLEPVARGEGGLGPHLHVVGVEGVGHDEDRMVLVPEREVVRVVVHVVGEPLLREQAPGVVGEEIAGEPPPGAGPGGALDRIGRPPDEVPFLGLFEAMLVHPAPTVAAHLVQPGRDPPGEVRRLLQTHGRRGERGRHRVPLEERHHPRPPPALRP